MFPQLPPWRRQSAIQRLAWQERTRASRDYYPTRLLQLCGVQPAQTFEGIRQLAVLYLLQQSALYFLCFEDRPIELTGQAGWTLRWAWLEAAYAVAEEDVNRRTLQDVKDEQDSDEELRELQIVQR